MNINDISIYDIFFVNNQENSNILKYFILNMKSIRQLYLSSNNMGMKQETMLYLNEGLKINNSIELLDLGINNLEMNKDNMLYFYQSLITSVLQYDFS